MKAMKFDVTGKPELSAAIQERLFELGYAWGRNNTEVENLNEPHIYTETQYGMITYGATPGFFFAHKNTLTTLSDLYDLPPDHTIVIDGNTIELSAESYKALKESLA